MASREKGSLWAQVLLHKYNRTEQGRYGSASNAWKGIMAAMPIVDDGLVKIVRNGCNTHFWMDKWIGDQPLYQLMRAPVSLPELYASANDYWEEGMGWK